MLDFVTNNYCFEVCGEGPTTIPVKETSELDLRISNLVDQFLEPPDEPEVPEKELDSYPTEEEEASQAVLGGDCGDSSEEKEEQT